MKILMAVDGIRQAERIRRTTTGLLRRGQHELDLLCVVPQMHWPSESSQSRKVSRAREQRQQQLESQAREMMTHLQAALRIQGIEVGARVETGSPARIINQVSVGYDLTILGAHGGEEERNRGLGRTALGVVSHAPGATLIVRDGLSERSIRILVAVDGSLASEFALRRMMTWFNADTAEITLLHVSETPWIHLGLDEERISYPEDISDPADVERQLEFDLYSESQSVLAETRQILERHNLSANLIAQEGDPALQIISEAESGEYDLIVIGATGRSDYKHQILGSVSTRVAQDALCSVFIARFIE